MRHAGFIPIVRPATKRLPRHTNIVRTTLSGFMKQTLGNYYQISSVICGNLVDGTDRGGLQFKICKCRVHKSWCVFLIHGIDSDGDIHRFIYVLRSSLQYSWRPRSAFWVSLLESRALCKRTQCRGRAESSNTATVLLCSNRQPRQHDLQLPADHPQASSRGLAAVKVSQNGLPVTTSIVNVNSVKYVMFDVVTGCEHVLSKNPLRDF